MISPMSSDGRSTDDSTSRMANILAFGTLPALTLAKKAATLKHN